MGMAINALKEAIAQAGSYEEQTESEVTAGT
jgi:hypothetical protein